MKQRYTVWRHYSPLFTGTYAECRDYLVTADPDNASYYRATRYGIKRAKGRYTSFADSLSWACCMTEFCCLSYERVL